MKRIFVLFLAAALALSLCACKKAEPHELTGTWQTQWELGGELSVDVELLIQENGDYALTVNAGEVLKKLDELTQVMEQAGAEVSAGVDQALGAAGINLQGIQTVLDLLFPKNGDDGQRKETATIQGRCKTEDGKLYISLVKGLGLYGDTYVLYAVEGDALTLSMPETDSQITQMLGGFLPVTLQKTA